MKLLDLVIPGWVKLVGAGIVALCVAWMLAAVKGWHDDSQALPDVKRERDAAIAETAQVRADLTAEAFRLATINKGLSDENEALRSIRVNLPVRSVRLCTAARPAGEADPAAPGRGDAGPAGAGLLPEEAGLHPAAGPDIGPDLYALMDEADEVVRRARGGQAYMAGLPAACLVP